MVPTGARTAAPLPRPAPPNNTSLSRSNASSPAGLSTRPSESAASTALRQGAGSPSKPLDLPRSSRLTRPAPSLSVSTKLGAAAPSPPLTPPPEGRRLTSGALLPPSRRPVSVVGVGLGGGAVPDSGGRAPATRP